MNAIIDGLWPEGEAAIADRLGWDRADLNGFETV